MSYFQKVRGLHLELRENVAETADNASLGIEYGILAFFLLLNYPSLFHISVKNRHAHVQFYLRQVQYFSSEDT